MVGHVGNSQPTIASASVQAFSLQTMSLNELAELLFCSSLQPSQYVDEDVVGAALCESLQAHHGQVAHCAEELAACYGKDPEVTCYRMRWVRTVLTQAYGRRAAAH